MPPREDDMNCGWFEEQLLDYVDGRLPAGSRCRMEEHANICAACGRMLGVMQGDLAVSSLELQAGLTREILSRTSGSACNRCRSLLIGQREGTLESEDSLLLEMHLRYCIDCREVDSALTALETELPFEAEMPPGADLVDEVLSRTTQRAGLPPQYRPIPLFCRSRPVRRPQIAWEVACAATLCMVFILWHSWFPLRDQADRSMAAAWSQAEAGCRAAVQTLSNLREDLASRSLTAARRSWKVLIGTAPELEKRVALSVRQAEGLTQEIRVRLFETARCFTEKAFSAWQDIRRDFYENSRRRESVS